MVVSIGWAISTSTCGFPVQQRIHHWISFIVWHCVLGSVFAYLLQLFAGTLISAAAMVGDLFVLSASRSLLWGHQTE